MCDKRAMSDPLLVARRLAVLDALARYTLAADGDDAAAYVACFTDDAALAYEGPDGVETTRVTGARAIGRVFAAQLAHRRGRTRHVASVAAFEALDERTADTRTPFVVTVAVGREMRLVASGVYRDRWTFVDGTARLVERIVALDAPLG